MSLQPDVISGYEWPRAQGAFPIQNSALSYVLIEIQIQIQIVYIYIVYICIHCIQLCIDANTNRQQIWSLVLSTLSFQFGLISCVHTTEEDKGNNED